MTSSGGKIEQESQQKTQATCRCGAEYEAEAVPGLNPLTGGQLFYPAECPECSSRRRQEKDAEHQAWLKQTRADNFVRTLSKTGVVEDAYRNRFLTLDSFVSPTPTTDQQKREAEAKRRIVEWMNALNPVRELRPERPGLYLSGEPGLGKSHLAKAAAVALVYQGEKSVRFTEFDELLRTMRGRIDVGSGQTMDDVLREYCEISWLILDDLGANEKPSDFSARTLFALINTRLRYGLPTLITSNYEYADLARRILAKDRDGRIIGDEVEADRVVERIIELCGDGVELAGQSYRLASLS